MHAGTHAIGVDIGGTHIASAPVYTDSGSLATEAAGSDVNSHAPAEEVLACWTDSIRLSLADIQPGQLAGIGIAMPGPFDYDNGICLMRDVGKYEHLYGLNIRTELRRRLSLPDGVPILFRNDATCYLLGETWAGAARGCGRAIGITLGTGFGSAFWADGAIREAGDDMPPSGWFYNVPFRHGIAEDYFSTRGLLRLYKNETGCEVPGVIEIARLAEQGTGAAGGILRHFGEILAEFLAPWIGRFHPDIIVFGGNISRSWELFAPAMKTEIARDFPGTRLVPSSLFDQAALVGAARLPILYREP